MYEISGLEFVKKESEINKNDDFREKIGELKEKSEPKSESKIDFVNGVVETESEKPKSDFGGEGKYFTKDDVTKNRPEPENGPENEKELESENENSDTEFVSDETNDESGDSEMVESDENNDSEN